MIALIVGWGPEAITRVALDLVGREQQVVYVAPEVALENFMGRTGYIDVISAVVLETPASRFALLAF